jgi:hypothetical protein
MNISLNHFTVKYPKDTAAIVLKEAAENMVKLARLQRAREIA